MLAVEPDRANRRALLFHPFTPRASAVDDRLWQLVREVSHQIASLPIGYDLSIETGRQWGLYVSRGRPGTTEPAMFCEPGFFIVESDATLYWAATASMPFARPRVDDVLHALDAIVERGYPARGEA